MAPDPARATARLASAFALLLLIAAPAHALRLVNWNVLNYPGTTGPARDPLYRTVLAPLGAEVLVTEEQRSQAGVTEYLNSLNTMEPGEWAAAPFVPGGDTQAALFYKPARVTFIGQRAFYPNSAALLRQVNVYRLIPAGYASPAAEFDVYALHLKASTGFEAQRLAEATGIRDSLNALPAGTHVLVVGDYNFYSGAEVGMVKLLENQVNNIGQLYDPLGLQGLPWQDNTSMQYAWTQSTCKTGDTGCASGAATGGIDDRFDLVLPTGAFKDGAGLELVVGSYRSVGNDGLHHNNSIQDSPTIPEGAAYAAALHGTSDHLPVRVDLRLPARLSTDTAPIAFGTVIVGASATHTITVADAAPVPGEALAYTYAAPSGFLAPAGTLTVAAGSSSDDLVGMDTTTPGARSGSLALASNSVDGPNASYTLSGTVLRHAVPSLDSLAAVVTGTLDFGTHDSTSFTPMELRVHDLGYDGLQARLSVASAAITGGDGRFSLVGDFAPALLADTGHSWDVLFDAAGATPDSLYEATLSFGTADEPLPGATAQASLALALQATRKGADGTTAVGPSTPTATLLHAPYPNPLRGAGTLRFDLARAGEVALEVFDVSGRRTATLVHGSLEPGRYSVTWNGGADGAIAHAGLYFVRLTAPGTPRQVVRLAVVN